VLCGDSGVIHSGQPQSVVTLHTLSANDAVLNSRIQHMPHVQRTGHVGRRHHDDEAVAVGLIIGLEISLRFPPAVPPALHILWVVCLGDLRFHLVFLISSRTIFSVMSGTISHAMVSMTCAEIFCITRSAMRSTSFSVIEAA